MPNLTPEVLDEIEKAIACISQPLSGPDIDVLDREVEWAIDSPHPDIGIYVSSGARDQADPLVEEARDTADAIIALVNHANSLVKLAKIGMAAAWERDRWRALAVKVHDQACYGNRHAATAADGTRFGVIATMVGGVLTAIANAEDGQLVIPQPPEATASPPPASRPARRDPE